MPMAMYILVTLRMEDKKAKADMYGDVEPSTLAISGII